MKDMVFRVEGMTCGYCEVTINDAVRKLPGIRKVKASKRKGQVAVSFDEGAVGEAAIKAAIEGTGYRVVQG